MSFQRNRQNGNTIAALPPGSSERAERRSEAELLEAAERMQTQRAHAGLLAALPSPRSKAPGLVALSIAALLMSTATISRAETPAPAAPSAKEVEVLRGLLSLQYPAMFRLAAATGAATQPAVEAVVTVQNDKADSR